MALRHDLTPQLRAATDARVAEAQRLGDTYIGVKHLLLGALAVEDAAATAILRRLGCDLDAVRTTLDAVADERPAEADPDKLPMTRDADRAIQRCFEEASKLGSPMVGTEHLLLGVLAKPLGGLVPSNPVAKVLARDYGVTFRKVRRAVKEQSAEAA